MKNIFTRIAPQTWLLLALCAGFIGLIYWASVGKLESVSRAKGHVMTVQHTQVIQSAQDGVIARFNVVEGQHIKKDAPLVTLENTQAQAALSDSQGKVAALRASLVRLNTEVFGRPLVFPPELDKYPTFVDDQSQLYQRRKDALETEVNTLSQNEKLIRQELAMAKKLLTEGDISQVEVLRLRRQVVELEGQITARKNRYFQDAQAEMTKVNEQLSTEEQILADRQVSYQRTEIYSPVDGVVSRIDINTTGARVRPGEIIMEVLPTNSELIVEAKVSPADIGLLRTGLPASVKLDAWDYTIYGTLDGTVTYISPDALTEKTAQGETTYYQVNVAVKNVEKIRQQAGEIELQAGLTGTVEIYTGEKTMLQYLLKPVIKTLSESLTES